MSNVQLIWENNGHVIDSVGVCCSYSDGIQYVVKKYLLEFLTNKPNPIISRDWSNFGQDGDRIIVKEI